MVIDHPDQLDRLLVALRATQPMPARMTPRLLAILPEQDPSLPPIPASGAFLLGEEAGYMTGPTMVVDGALALP